MVKAVHLFIAAGILALGMALGGLFIGKGFVDARSADRFVTVRGLAEQDVVADIGTWTIRYLANGDSLSAVQASIDEDTRAIRAFLADYGFTGEEVSIADVRVEDRATYSYDQRGFGETRFNINQTVQVRTAKVDALQKAIANMTKLVSQGVVLQTSENDARFSFTRLNDVKPGMIAAATKNAREAAEQFASDSDSNIGGIRQATQGYFSILPRNGDFGSAEGTPLQRVRVVTTVDFLLAD